MQFGLGTVIVLSVCVVAGCSRSSVDSQGMDKKAHASQVLYASEGIDGQPHPATLGLTGPAIVTCLKASGAAGQPASCNINGQAVNPPNGSIGANQSVVLNCNGNTPVSCSARVDQ
jgi:hypothetical protein